MTPRYTQDCDRCRFLGRVDIYDIYVCQDDPTGVTSPTDEITMLARYSSEPGHYASNGFMRRTVVEVQADTGGLSEDEAMVLALFRRLPSLILNIWRRA